MKKTLISLLSLFALVACTEGKPEVPNNEGNGDNGGNGNTEQPADPETEPFAIEVEELHASRAITQVVPADSEMYYIMFLDEVSYLQNGGIDTQEKLWEDDFTAFEGGAIGANMNLKEYMLKANILFQGTKRVQWNTLLPGMKSILYIYGVEFSEDGASYEPVTDITWEVMQPEYAPLQDINFNIDVAVKGAEVSIAVEPENYDGHYVVKIVDVNTDLYPNDDTAFTDEYMATIADEWVYVYDGNLDGGRTKEEIFENVCFTGKRTLEYELNSSAMYSVLVYAVDEYDGFVQVVSKPSYYNFVTEEVQQSDMEIDIDITNCYVRVADLRITSTDPEAQYIMMITPTSYLPEDYTDQTLLEYTLGEFYYYTYTFKGEMTSHLNTLYPNTEYVVVAFGYSGGVVTTKVYTEVFKTEVEGECELEVTDVVVGGPYRVSDLYAYDPETFEYYKPPYYYDSSHFVITMEVKTSEPTTDIFSDFIYKADYDYHGYNTMFFDLLIDTCEPYYVTTIEWEWTDTDIFAKCYACAAAFDYKGNVTPMWMSQLYEWTMDDIRPIEEFIEKWEANKSNTQLLMVRPASKR